jgi:hypothetical protein
MWFAEPITIWFAAGLEKKDNVDNYVMKSFIILTVQLMVSEYYMKGER